MTQPHASVCLKSFYKELEKTNKENQHTIPKRVFSIKLTIFQKAPLYVSMKLRITPKYVLAFLSLVFVMHEAHEIAHTVVGRILCGCWGQRDFNSWGVCEGCPERQPLAILSTFAGPLFTFAMIWAGVILTGKGRSDRQNAMGFSLIFANLPFARILTAALGSGDEVWGFSNLLGNKTFAWPIGLLLVCSLSVFPLWKAFQLIENKRKAGWFFLFLIVPVLADIAVVLGLMNTLLANGIFSEYWILGSPKLVTVWTGVVTGLYIFTYKHIYSLTGNYD